MMMFTMMMIMINRDIDCVVYVLHNTGRATVQDQDGGPGQEDYVNKMRQEIAADGALYVSVNV